MNLAVVSSKAKELDLYAMFAVADAAFDPPMKDKKSVYVKVTQTLTFSNAMAADGGGCGPRGGGGGGTRGGGGGGFGGGGGGGGLGTET